VGAYTRERARDRLVGLSSKGLDLVTLWDECGDVLSPAVPHYLTACWFTLDPATLLATSHYDHGLIPHIPRDWLTHEYYGDDAHDIASVACSRGGLSTLHEAAGDDLGSSARWQRNRELGADQELIVALRTRRGEPWGLLALYREPGKPFFSDEELALLVEVSPYLAEAAKRALLIGEAADPGEPDAPGLVVLRSDWTVESLTPGVDRWLADFPDGDWEGGGALPSAVLSVAARALRTAENGDTPGEVAVARVLSRSGRWMVLHGASLVADGGRRVAVIVEPAHPARITPLLMAAYGLTEREQEVTRHVLHGDSTAQIAAALYVSPHTVQEHLKNVFEKTGVRSRRDLVGKVFFSHYEPLFRENEQRAIDGEPLRGGPLSDRRESR
jgi:DNA-binding CsgD family transcriptional regulator